MHNTCLRPEVSSGSQPSRQCGTGLCSTSSAHAQGFMYRRWLVELSRLAITWHVVLERCLQAGSNLYILWRLTRVRGRKERSDWATQISLSQPQRQVMISCPQQFERAASVSCDEAHQQWYDLGLTAMQELWHLVLSGSLFLEPFLSDADALVAPSPTFF